MSKSPSLEPSASPDVGSRELEEYIAYACVSKSSQVATIETHQFAIKHFHRIAKGIGLETAHLVVVHALKGMTRCHAKFGT